MAVEGASDAAVEISKPPANAFSMVTITDRNSKDLSVFPPINHEGLHDSSPHDSPCFSSPCRSSSSFSSYTSVSDDSGAGFSDVFLAPDSTKEDFPLAADCVDRSPQQLDGDARVQISTACGWLRFGLEVLRRKVRNSTTCSIPGYEALIAPFRPFPLLTTLTAVYVCSLVLTWVRMRRKTDMLMAAIRERDEKIVKMLDQIALLNQMLLSHNRLQ